MPQVRSLSTLVKTAHVRPLLKKPHLDPEDFSHYRPVSNLLFLAKIIEEVVAARLNLHLEKHDLQEQYQSAYIKANHSVETALVSVQDYILRAMDSQRVVVLVMLDLSVAFDTVNHEVLLERLSGNIGISLPYSGSDHASQKGSSSSECRAILRPAYH